jgi:simple sugar transport system permease protein
MSVTNRLRQQILRQTLSMSSAILLAVVLGIALLAMDGFTPGAVLQGSFDGTFSSSFRLANTASRMITLTLVSLAAAVPFKTGMWNIGGDGQLIIGAFMSALVGFSFKGLPAAIHVPLAVLAGMLGGALWAAIPAILKLRFRANEIVTTIMMNYLATLFTDYLVNYPFRAPGSPTPQTVLVAESAQFNQLIPLSTLNSGLYLVLVVFLVVYFIDSRTAWGYEWKALGANHEFSRAGGIDDKRMRLLAMCIGGALAGLAGTILVLGNYHKFLSGIGASVGINGVLITLIASNSPILIMIVAAIFAILQSSVIGLEAKLGVAVEFSDILQSIIILIVITRAKLWSYFSDLKDRRSHHGNAG